MKESKDVPLTKAQRQGLIVAATNELRLSPNEHRNPALRNAVKRLKRVDRVAGDTTGSVVGSAASGADATDDDFADASSGSCPDYCGHDHARDAQ